MSDPGQEAGVGGEAGAGGYPNEEELRAAYEQQVKKIRLEQVVLENVVTVLNLGMRRTGIAAGTEDERDPEQVRIAIESVRSQLPLLEQVAPEHVPQIRDALSQLQMAFVRIGGQAPEAPGDPERAAGGAPGGSEAAGGGPPGGGWSPSSQGGPGEPATPGASGSEPPSKPGEPGPAQRSGRLWVPGQ